MQDNKNKPSLSDMYPMPKTYEQRKIEQNDREQRKAERNKKHAALKVAGVLTMPMAVLLAGTVAISLLQSNPMVGVFSAFFVGIAWFLYEGYSLRTARDKLDNAGVYVLPVMVAHIAVYLFGIVPMILRGVVFNDNTFQLADASAGQLLFGVGAAAVHFVVMLAVVALMQKLTK